jgi:hypothetical protein
VIRTLLDYGAVAPAKARRGGDLAGEKGGGGIAGDSAKLMNGSLEGPSYYLKCLSMIQRADQRDPVPDFWEQRTFFQINLRI